MTPCHIVKFKTPKGFNLTGLWYGPKKAKRVLVFVHGLGVSAFGRVEREIAPLVSDSRTAVLAFNNRGHDIVSNLYKDDPRLKKGYHRITAGTAHEKFIDCVDDIQGAINFAKKVSGGRVYLAGHSTGCQKSIYWAYKKKSRGVKGIILLAPVSDYAVGTARKNLKDVVRYARDLVKKGRPHELLKGESYDAQRFLSLYTSDSPEEVFTYIQAKKRPRVLRAVRTSILMLWAAEDEYNDRPLSEITGWFGKNILSKHRIVVVPRAKHSFKGAERRVANEIQKFIRE